MLALKVLFFILTLWSLNIIQTTSQTSIKKKTCSSNEHKVVVQPGAQALLVGLLAFHEQGTVGYGCGGAYSASMQSYEALRWALDLLNKKNEILNGQLLTDTYVPGIPLGMIVQDTCNHELIAIGATQDVIQRLHARPDNCLASSNSTLLLGVIGASSSDVTMSIADFTKKLNLPVVSFMASSPALSDSLRFPYFLRTIPADGPLMAVMVEVLKKLNWKFVTVVYTDDAYGRGALAKLREIADINGICLTTAISTPDNDLSPAKMKLVLGKVIASGALGVVYLGSSQVAKSLMNEANIYPGATQLQWITTDSIPLSHSFSMNTYPRGIISVLPGTRFIVEFEDHWKRLNESNPPSENPWFKEWYMTEKKCRLPGVGYLPFSNYLQCATETEKQKRESFVQDQFVEPAVHSVFTYAHALRNAQKSLCGSTSGACQALLDLSSRNFVEKYLKKVNFTYTTDERIPSFSSQIYAPYYSAKHLSFESNGDIVKPVFDIWNFNDKNEPSEQSGFRFRRVGIYANGKMSLNLDKIRMYNLQRTTALKSLPSSLCSSLPCKPCLGAKQETKYLYVKGDIVLNGFFSVHNAGQIPLSCGKFNKNTQAGIIYLEAMIYSLAKIQRMNILHGVTLGGIGYDDCSSHSLATSFISEVQRNAITVKDISGVALNPHTVEVYTGLSTSSLTIPIAEMMNSIQKPLVGYSATSDELSDKQRFPFFIRTVPSDVVQMRAIAYMLRKLNWFYVQVVYSADSYGRSGLKELKRAAAWFGICIVASHELEDSYMNIIQKLRHKSQVKPVVLIINEKQISGLFIAIKAQSAVGEFVLIGTESWGTSKKVVFGMENIAEGSLTLKLRAPNLPNFLLYLKDLNIQTYKINPWFKEWYQTIYNCSLHSSNLMGYTKFCNSTSRSITDAPEFELNTYSLFVMNAVHAVAYGLHETLKEFCGISYFGLCSNYTTARNKGEVLLKKMNSISFTDETGETFSFMDRQANTPYEIYNYRSGSYMKVGDFITKTNNLNLDVNSIKVTNNATPASVKPKCVATCIECQYLFREQHSMYIPGTLIIPAIFDVHYAGKSPYVCGPLRSVNGFQYTEAFAFALDWINSGNASVKLNNVTLGGLAFDGCTNPTRAKTLVASLHYGIFNFTGTRIANVQANKFQSWISYDSGSTIGMAKVLQKINVPLVSPGATSPVLFDKKMFTTFFRTIPSDKHTSKAIALLAKDLGFFYIITLNAPDAGSRDALAEFRTQVKAFGICIASSYEFVTDGSYQQIIYYITRSTTRVVVVFAEPDQHVFDLLKSKENFPAAHDIIFIANRPWEIPARKVNHSTVEKTITFQIHYPLISQFRNYLLTQLPSLNHRNPWFNEYFENYYNCYLWENWANKTKCAMNKSVVEGIFQQDMWILPTINAVFAVAKGIEMTLKQKCSTSYSGVCSKFYTDGDTYKQIMKNMDSLTFTDLSAQTFKFINRETNRQIIIKQFTKGSPTQVALYTAKNLISPNNLSAEYQYVLSRCFGVCAQCDKNKVNQEKFTFIDGDIMIAGLFDVHKGLTSYTCGEINEKHGFQLVEAFNYAIEYVNDANNRRNGIFSGMLKGVKLGGIALDVCQRPDRAGNLIANIHSHNIRLSDNASNIQVDPNDLNVYIGPFDSESSIRVADILNVLGIPQISYGATSLELRDSKKYPYFLRTVPADDKQARAIVSLLKRFEIKFVQIISTYNSVGQNGLKEFARVAYLNKICLTHNITIGKNGSAITLSEAEATINRLLDHPKTTVIILFVDDPKLILEAAEKNIKVAGNFLFIGTDKWGADSDILKNLKNLLKQKHVVTLDVETADLPGFDKYLETKVPTNYTRNPWFDEYYQKLFNCYLINKDEKYPKQCTKFLRGLSRANNYVQDPYVLYVVNAVFSAAMGVHYALREFCGINYEGACNLFRKNGERRQQILQGIKKANFFDATMQPFAYTNGGESDRGYHIYEPVEINSSIQKYRYQNVGSYNDTHYLKLDARYKLKWSSDCSQPSVCEICKFPVYSPSRYMLKKSPFDLNIVGIFDIHKPHPSDNEKCGTLDFSSGFQNLMAFFYAINYVNTNKEFKLSNTLKLGGLALDTCSFPPRLGQDIYSLLSGEALCGVDSGSTGQILTPSTVISFLTKGSPNSVPVASMVSPLKITTISPSATSVELSNKILYPHFLRTVPPDNIQAFVMNEILKKFKWNYASAIYADNAYGNSAIATLLQQINQAQRNTCITMKIAIPVNATLSVAKNIIVKLNQESGARVVVLFVTDNHVRLLLKAAKELKLERRFIWLGSDTWANSKIVVEGLESVAAGAITIQIRSEIVESFKRYLKSLTLQNRRGVPDDWFEEFYQTIHQCRILNSVVEKPYPKICNGDEKIKDDSIPQDSYVFHTIIAVNMIAVGLNRIEKCKESALSLAACLLLEKNRNELIYNSILRAHWNVLSDELDASKSFTFRFTESGYGDVGYDILNYQFSPLENSYKYVKIGSWVERMTLNVDQYRSSTLETLIKPTSECPLGRTCNCLDSSGNTIKYTQDHKTSSYVSSNALVYIDPESGNVINIKASPGITQRFSQVWGTIVAAIAAFGLFISISLFVYLLIVYPFRGGTTILGFTFLFGIITLYALVFAFIVHATPEICGLRRFCLGFCYAIAYSALFVKLTDSFRTRDKKELYEVKYKKLAHPMGLFLITCLLITVQIIINIEWLILRPPTSVVIPYSGVEWPRCTPSSFYDEGLVLSLVYVMFIIILCMMLGFCTWRNPKNHYESRWILGIILLSIPTWILWCLVAIIGDYKVRDPAVIIGLLVNATIMLLLGPVRRFYLLNDYQKQAKQEAASLHLSDPDDTDYASHVNYNTAPRLRDPGFVREYEISTY